MRFSGIRRPFSRTVVLVSVALLALLSIGVASAQTGQAGGITKEAHHMHALYVFVLVMAVVVFVIVEGLILFAVFRYRRRSDELPPQFHGSSVVEILWTGIPVLIVVAIFAYSFIVLRQVEHTEDPCNTTVNVEGFQFQWAFTYNLNQLDNCKNPNAQGSFVITGTQAKEPTLVIPVDEPVEFKLTSHDVIHAFYIHDFLYKLDVIPGRENHFTVTPTKVGEFVGQCAELCGLNHALMRFHVSVVSRADFDKWVSQQPVKLPSATAAPSGSTTATTPAAGQ
jgi:cytochrome c oxidase subunit 2